MCLESLKEEYESPSNMIMDGWKEFDGVGNNLTFQIDGQLVVFDKWLTAKETRISGLILGGESYTSGFHVYCNDEEIRKTWGHYRHVYIRKVTYLGRQDGKDVVVAKEMYVPSDPDGWPPHPSFPDNRSFLNKLKAKLPGGNA